MEALDEAVGGTAGCVLSGALLTLAALLLLNGAGEAAGLKWPPPCLTTPPHPPPWAI